MSTFWLVLGLVLGFLNGCFVGAIFQIHLCSYLKDKAEKEARRDIDNLRNNID